VPEIIKNNLNKCRYSRLANCIKEAPMEPEYLAGLFYKQDIPNGIKIN
jgi:hypothetical protein